MVEDTSFFGANLRRIREEKKVSRQELEQKTGIPAVTLAGYENTTRTPDLSRLIAIADTLKVTTDELLGRADFLNREKEKKKIAQRFGRAEKLMTILGLCIEESPYIYYDDVFDNIDIYTDEILKKEYKHFPTRLEFVEFIETVERQAARENKSFKEVFFEKIDFKNNR